LIRAATSADVPRVVEMGLRFRRETNYQRHIAENPAALANMAALLVNAGGLLVSERERRIVGMIGFYLFPHFLSGEQIAGEVCWWVEPEFRGEGIKLLRAAETAARAAGAVRMQMIAPTNQVATIYQRCGYEFIEAAYQRTL
jgi:GNAT superfamily N-acetyltransferase